MPLTAREDRLTGSQIVAGLPALQFTTVIVAIASPTWWCTRMDQCWARAHRRDEYDGG